MSLAITASSAASLEKKRQRNSPFTEGRLDAGTLPKEFLPGVEADRPFSTPLTMLERKNPATIRSMPANLTPQYLEAERRYKQAASTGEKVQALEEMLSIIPKHKGTEKLQADLKSRLKKLRAELEKPSGSGGRHDTFDVVKREGAGQIVLLGAANTGKSSLLAHLTNASPEVAAYPYTTRLPQPGMMPFENIQIQLVDLPAIDREFWKPRLSGIIRNADGGLLLADLAAPDTLEQVETTIAILEEARIHPASARDDSSLTGGAALLKTLLLASKSDRDPQGSAVEVLRELYDSRLPVLPVSTSDPQSLATLKVRLYEMLGIIRIYSKPPGKKFDPGDPFVLKKGSTVLEAAAHIHKDFADKLKFARIWGSEKYDGQMVQRDHLLEEGDVVEFHI
ncbi:MAG: TGS domain-containing protein [Acidobacteriota bacterium]